MKFLWGLLAGFALGVAAGLLLAPQSGEATRAQLNEQAIQLRDNAGKLPDQLRTSADSVTEGLRSRASDAMDQGREIYSRTKDDLSDRYSKAKSGDM